jgi:hypothetical protein
MNPRARKDDAPRMCSACGVKLSSYNRNETCWAHTVELPWQGPNTKPR